MTCRDVLLKTKQAQGWRDLMEVRLLANDLELEGNITLKEVGLLLAARCAMRKALACRTFTAVAKLEKAYAKIHRELFFDEKAAERFFSWILVDRRMKLFYESQLGKGVKVLFRTNPSVTMAALDGAMVSVSGRGQ